MTEVKFFKQDNNYVGILCEGHTGFAEYGKDIVCAAISSITGALALGVTQVLKIKASVKKNDEKGYLELRLPKKIDESELLRAQVLFETAHIALLDLQEGYPSNINVEVN
ncbi:MAG: ribosomal-processing cysteine protease Prp [Clostridia bacterium]|nr:ribosomal-processing cysteine protease Prp [Clostridia bacterium]